MPRTPLVLVPGLTCTCALWQPQLDALADVADMTVADHMRDDTMVSIARRILSSAPPKFALAGLSMGGYISFEIMRQAPERVSKLALLDTKATLDPPERAKDRQALVERARRDGMEPVMRGYLPVFIQKSRVDEKPLSDIVVQMGVDTGADAFARQQNAIISRSDSVPTLATIKCPTLVLVGREDALTTVADHERIHAGIAGSTLEIIEDCGHLTTLERPEVVNAALRRWLAA